MERICEVLIFIRLNLYFVVLIMIIFYFIYICRFGGGLEEDDIIFSRVFKIIKWFKDFWDKEYVGVYYEMSLWN